MESEDNFSDGVFKTRPVLTDVTNRPAKRPFSLISGDDGNSQFTKQVCLGVENLVKKKCQLQFGAQAHLNKKDKVLLQPQDKHFKLPFCGDTSLVSQRPNDRKEEQNRLGVENCVGSREKGEGIPPTDRGGDWGDRDLCFDNLGLPECGALEMSAISASRDSNKFLGLERCSGFKGNGGAKSVTDGGDLLKSCTCSFCCKAAYIWSDLHYQDVKGRLSALKKSQKEASMIIQKFSGLKDTVIHDPQRSVESSKLESSLMHQWKSLFVHMENIYAQESSQLESSFETLKDLRETCKNDLELNDNSHRDNH